MKKRLSNDAPYITHPLDLSMQLWGMYKDEPLSIAALLHDTVEDCDEIHIEDIYREFGSKVGYIVDSLTNTELWFYGEDRRSTKIDEIDKILIGGMRDVRVFVTKIADREYNLKTVGCLPKSLQKRLKDEYKKYYLPLKKILSNRTVIEELESNINHIIKENNIHNYKDFRIFLENSYLGNTE